MALESGKTPKAGIGSGTDIVPGTTKWKIEDGATEIDKTVATNGKRKSSIPGRQSSKATIETYYDPSCATLEDALLDPDTAIVIKFYVEDADTTPAESWNCRVTADLDTNGLEGMAKRTITVYHDSPAT